MLQFPLDQSKVDLTLKLRTASLTGTLPCIKIYTRSLFSNLNKSTLYSQRLQNYTVHEATFKGGVQPNSSMRTAFKILKNLML